MTDLTRCNSIISMVYAMDDLGDDRQILMNSDNVFTIMVEAPVIKDIALELFPDDFEWILPAKEDRKASKVLERINYNMTNNVNDGSAYCEDCIYLLEVVGRMINAMHELLEKNIASQYEDSDEIVHSRFVHDVDHEDHDCCGYINNRGRRHIY